MGAAPNLSLGAVRTRGKVFWFVVLASLGAAFAASPFGCGLDDSAVDQIGTSDGSTDTSFVEEGGPIGDGGADVVVCDPETCNNFPSVCRSGIDNGCGGTVDCTNACPAGHACIKDSGTCDGPPVCRDAGSPGGNCGEIVNPGNGLDASCGTCGGNYTCTSSACDCIGSPCGAGGATCCQSSSGTPNCNNTNGTCCKLKTCAVDYAGFCNPVSDNACGGNLNCSSNCTGGTQCGTTGYVCDTPLTCTNQDNPGGSCGILTTTHGVQTNCGTCNNAYMCTNNICGCTNNTCNGTCCTSTQTECQGTTCCTPDPTSTTCNNKCGTVNDNCGIPTNCGSCDTGDVCFGSGTCDCHGQTCNPGDECCHAGGYYCHSGGKCS